ncbi:hypothetical protein PG995_001482 [Apiospora arundinis]
MNCFGPPPRKRKSSSKKNKSKKSSANMMPDPIDILLNEEFERAKATRKFAYFRSFMGNPSSDQPAFSFQSNWWEPSHNLRRSDWATHHDTLNETFAKTKENGSNIESLRSAVDGMYESHGNDTKKNGDDHDRIIKAQEVQEAQMKKHGDSLDKILQISQGLDEDVRRRRELEEQQRMRDALKNSFEQGKQAQLDTDVKKRWELEEQKRLQEALFESYEKGRKAQFEVQEQITKSPPPAATSVKNTDTPPLPRVEALSDHLLSKIQQREEDERLEYSHRQWHARLEDEEERVNRREQNKAARLARLMGEDSRLRARMGASREDMLPQERMFPAPRYRVDYEDESLELGAPWGNDMTDRRAPPQRYSRTGGGRRTHPRYSSEFGYFP